MHAFGLIVGCCVGAGVDVEGIVGVGVIVGVEDITGVFDAVGPGEGVKPIGVGVGVLIGAEAVGDGVSVGVGPPLCVAVGVDPLGVPRSSTSIDVTLRSGLGGVGVTVILT